MEPFDIFIPVAPKDAVKIPYLLDSIRKHVPGYDRIYLCTARDGVPSDEALGDRPVVRVREADVLQMDLRRLRHRPNWIYQQYLKLFQTVTTHDLYLTIDSDVVFNRAMPMFTPEGKRILYLGWEQNHDPYFKFQEMVLGLPRVYPHTFINDMNFMDRRIIREMLDRNGYTVASFIDRSCEVITADCYPAEPEIWGQYVHKHHAGRYEYRQAQTKMMAKGVSRFDEPGWTTGEIEQTIAELQQTYFDMLMFHSWFTTNEAQVVDGPVLTPEIREYPRPYLLKALEIFRARGLTSVVEIGCMRMPMNHPIDQLHIECCMDSHSSMYWPAETRDVDIVDVDPVAIETARNGIERSLGPDSGARFAAMDGILFLQARERPIDLLFLDAWDADLPESASKHLEAFVAAEKHLHERSLVLIDDTDCERIDGVLHLSKDGRKGKGALVIPYAESRGWRVAFFGRQTLLERGPPG